MLPVEVEPGQSPFFFKGPFRWAPQQLYGRPDWDLVLSTFVDYGHTYYSGELASTETDQNIGPLVYTVVCLQGTEGAAMEADRIQIKTLIISLASVILMEAVSRVGMRSYNPMLVLGAVRLLEAGLIVMIVLVREKGLSSIGLPLTGIIPWLKRGLIWSAGFGALAFLSFALFLAIGLNPRKLTHVCLPVRTGNIILFFIVGGFIGPITEELFFRGVLYGFLRRWGFLAAIILSTLAFVLAHSFSPSIPVTQVVGGLLFAVAYELEKDLIVPITIHALGTMALFTLSLVG